MSEMVTSDDVLKFWFEELNRADWFKKNLELDQEIRQRFEGTVIRASLGECFVWRDTIEGRLAEIIVLDQFSRNIYRDSARAFAQDGLALVLAQEAVARDLDSWLEYPQLAFLYMPYMHSESLLIHEQAVELFSKPGLESNLDFELRHKAIIDRFGRYPHRNEVLGRTSTAEEIAFLSEPGSSF